MLLLPPISLWADWSKEDFGSRDMPAMGYALYKRDLTADPPSYRFVRRIDDLPAKDLWDIP